jgi:hypothetical protein
VRIGEIVLRLALIAGSTILLLYGHVAVWITAPLTIAAIAATAELSIRPYATNTFDKLLLVCGSVVTGFILVGLILNLTPWGLTRASWTFALLALSTVTLARRVELGTHFKRPTRSINLLTLAVIAALVIVIGAAMLAFAGVRQWNEQPLMSFSLVSKSAEKVVVEIHATSFKGDYEIVAKRHTASAHRYISKPFEINAGGNGETLTEQVPIEHSGRWIIDLETVGHGGVVRELIIDIDD